MQSEKKPHDKILIESAEEKAGEADRKKIERAKAKDASILALLAELRLGIGWSSDIVLARYFSVPRQRIWVWSKEGKLPAPYKVGVATTRWKNEEVLKAEVNNFLGGL
jgi:hypothetical protein